MFANVISELYTIIIKDRHSKC